MTWWPQDLAHWRPLHSLPRRAFRRLVHRREDWVCLTRDLAAPMRPWRAPAGMTTRWLTEADLDHLHPQLAGKREGFAINLAGGHQCHAAFIDGQVVAVVWFTLDSALDTGERRFIFPREEIYAFSLFVAPMYRGSAMAAAVQTPAWADLRARDNEGRYRRLIRLVSVENEAALKLHRHMGFEPDGRARHDHFLFGRLISRQVERPVADMRRLIEARIGVRGAIAA